jgi:hypothetical protein
MNSERFIAFLKYVAIAGNIIFILWILYNGFNEGFKATVPEMVSYLGLILLLGLNCFLLSLKKRRQIRDFINISSKGV